MLVMGILKKATIFLEKKNINFSPTQTYYPQISFAVLGGSVDINRSIPGFPLTRWEYKLPHIPMWDPEGKPKGKYPTRGKDYRCKRLGADSSF